MTFSLPELAVAISAARSMIWLLDTAPFRINASSLTVTRMSSPGNSDLSCCSRTSDAGVDDDVVLLPLSAAPDDQADGAWRLAVDEDLARLDDDGVGNLRDP